MNSTGSTIIAGEGTTVSKLEGDNKKITGIYFYGSCLPVLSHQRLETIDINAHAVRAAAAVPSPSPLPYPAVDREVRRLRQVETMVETSVVGRGERYHEVSGLLRGRPGGGRRQAVRK